jgi:hypothetical protein
MTIDIGNGNKGEIRIFEGDDPYQLALDFCSTYRLSAKIVDILVENIKTNLDLVIQERKLKSHK